MYGQTAPGLALQLNVTKAEAQGFIDRFFHAYSGVAPWIEQTQQEARENGFVRTLYGRPRVLSEQITGDERSVGRALRQAVNTVIQGTAADIHKLAVARVFAVLPSDCHMLLPVHDSVLIEVPKGRRRKVAQLIREAMLEVPSGFSVPLAVTEGHGRNWQKCSEGSRNPTLRPARRRKTRSRH